MGAHSSALAWRIPWMEEPGGLQSMGSLRVGHDWATSLWLFTFMHWRRKWQPTPVFLPGESQGQGAWWAAVYGVTQSWTRLKRLGSSSLICTYKYLMSFCLLYDIFKTCTHREWDYLGFHFHALEKKMATHSSVLAWRIPGTGSLMGCCLWGRTESDTTEVT